MYPVATWTIKSEIAQTVRWLEPGNIVALSCPAEAFVITDGRILHSGTSQPKAATDRREVRPKLEADSLCMCVLFCRRATGRGWLATSLACSLQSRAHASARESVSEPAKVLNVQSSYVRCSAGSRTMASVRWMGARQRRRTRRCSGGRAVPEPLQQKFSGTAVVWSRFSAHNGFCAPRL